MICERCPSGASATHQVTYTYTGTSVLVCDECAAMALRLCPNGDHLKTVKLEGKCKLS